MAFACASGWCQFTLVGPLVDRFVDPQALFGRATLFGDQRMKGIPLGRYSKLRRSWTETHLARAAGRRRNRHAGRDKKRYDRSSAFSTLNLRIVSGDESTSNLFAPNPLRVRRRSASTLINRADAPQVLCHHLIYGFGPIAKALVTCLRRTPYGFGSVSRQPLSIGLTLH